MIFVLHATHSFTNSIFRLYLDAFAANNPIGSSSDKHKIMGFYYSIFNDLLFGSNRSSLQTVALLFQKDIGGFHLH